MASKSKPTKLSPLAYNRGAYNVPHPNKDSISSRCVKPCQVSVFLVSLGWNNQRVGGGIPMLGQCGRKTSQRHCTTSLTTLLRTLVPSVCQCHCNVTGPLKPLLWCWQIKLHNCCCSIKPTNSYDCSAIISAPPQELADSIASISGMHTLTKQIQKGVELTSAFPSSLFHCMTYTRPSFLLLL